MSLAFISMAVHVLLYILSYTWTCSHKCSYNASPLNVFRLKCTLFNCRLLFFDCSCCADTICQTCLIQVMTVLTWQSNKVPGSCAHNQAWISQRWKSCAPCSHEKYIISDNKTEQNTRIISGRVKNSVLPVLSQGYLPITCTSDPRPPTYLRWNYDVQTEKCAWRIPACGHFGR